LLEIHTAFEELVVSTIGDRPYSLAIGDKTTSVHQLIAMTRMSNFWVSENVELHMAPTEYL
jgi:hypothetical protein